MTSHRKGIEVGHRLILALCILVMLVIVITSCSTNQIPESQPDTPRYTADQVISVAEAYSPAIPYNYRVQCKELSWSAEYLRQGVWIVKKLCIDGWGITRGQIESWYFHENTGQLNKSRY